MLNPRKINVLAGILSIIMILVSFGTWIEIPLVDTLNLFGLNLKSSYSLTEIAGFLKTLGNIFALVGNTDAENGCVLFKWIIYVLWGWFVVKQLYFTYKSFIQPPQILHSSLPAILTVNIACFMIITGFNSSISENLDESIEFMKLGFAPIALLVLAIVSAALCTVSRYLLRRDSACCPENNFFSEDAQASTPFSSDERTDSGEPCQTESGLPAWMQNDYFRYLFNRFPWLKKSAIQAAIFISKIKNRLKDSINN